MRKGIGITTRNRPHVLRTTLEGFARTHTDEAKYVVVDDNGDHELHAEAHVAWFATQVDAEVVLRYSKERLGIAGAKNACLAALLDCDQLFMFDDDAFPKIPGWSDNWIAASNRWNIHHSMFNVAADKDNPTPFYRVTKTLGDSMKAMHDWSNCCGVALHFTRHAIDVLGGYDIARAANVYGYEHAQMSQRALTAGLTRGLRYPAPAHISEWIYSVDMSYFWLHEDPPVPVEWISNFRSSVTPEEAAKAEQNAQMMNTGEVFVPLIDPFVFQVDKDEPLVDAIIPCKSNFDGLRSLVASLAADPRVGEIVVVADGSRAHETIASFQLPVILLSVPLASGIHKMWNLGLDAVHSNARHVAIINDDVSLTSNAIGQVALMLDADGTKGLISPSQDPAHDFDFHETTAFAGYCMVLANDLALEWRFDERMMWWYGDNDVIMWVNRAKNRKTGLTGLCHALGNRSHTITNDPPPNFHADIHRDAALYKEKWG